MRQLVFALGLAALSVTASAHEITVRSLKIVHPWVYETEERQIALHAKIRNTGEAADRLLGASTAIADRISILDANDKETTGIPIPARGEISLQSGGPQIVLIGLKKHLFAYDNFDLVLVFRNAGRVTIDVLVEEADTPTKQRTGG
jgi:copper(I)-binding protein